MENYKHILLATDLSKGSQNVDKKSFELAKQMDAKLSVLHVVEPLSGYGFIGLADVETQLKKEAKKRLTELSKQYDIPQTSQYIEIGSTKTIINQKAEKLGIDLIVIGSHKRHGLDYLLGATANAVIQSAKCDILTVRFSREG